MDHHWLELASWLSNIVLCIVAIIGVKQIKAAVDQAKCALQQVRLTAQQIDQARKESELRAKRDSIASALDQCERFAATMIPNMAKLHTELTKQGYVARKEIDASFPYVPPSLDPIAQKVWMNNLDGVRMDILNALNEHEAFAMYFVNGLADERVAFAPTGQSYCMACELLASFIGLYRDKPGFDYCYNLVKLYQYWKTRLIRKELDQKAAEVQLQKAKLPVSDPLPPLGLNRDREN